MDLDRQKVEALKTKDVSSELRVSFEQGKIIFKVMLNVHFLQD
jgi:hypothetical protein